MTTQQPIITSATLREWNACMDGYNRFCELFPGGADLDTAVYGLIKDKKSSWAFWLINNAQKYNFCDVADVFKKLSKDDNFVVRMGTARNLNTPLDALKSLSQDNDVYVRVYANKTLQKMEKRYD